MMKSLTRKIIAFAVVSLSISTYTQAQDDISKLLEAGKEDANTLLEGYINPLMKGFGTGLANGWYNTAAVHKKLGFDLTITASLAAIPDEDLFYDLSSLKYTTLTSGGKDGKAPTMFGPDIATTYTFNDPNDSEDPVEFEGPEGLNIKDEIGIQSVPVPMAQLGIGLIKKTEITIRWTPEIEADDAKFKMLGFAVKHDVKQYIPGVKNLPFDLSAFVGYTSINSELALTTSEEPDPDVVITNGLGVFKVNSLTVQGLISKKFSVLTLYGGLGFNRVRSELRMEGKYDVNGKELVDPIDLSFKAGGPRATAGMRLKLAIITFHADYTVQEYNTLTLGFGFSVR